MKTRVSLKYFVKGCRYQISAQTNNFDFFGPNVSQNGVSGLKQKN